MEIAKYLMLYFKQTEKLMYLRVYSFQDIT